MCHITLYVQTHMRHIYIRIWGPYVCTYLLHVNCTFTIKNMVTLRIVIYTEFTYVRISVHTIVGVQYYVAHT